MRTREEIMDLLMDDLEGAYGIRMNWLKARAYQARTLEVLLDIRDLFNGQPKESGCPPHLFVDYVYEGAWGGSVPPPNKKCMKCLYQ